MPKRLAVRSIMVREVPTSARRMARLDSTSRMTAFSVSIRQLVAEAKKVRPLWAPVHYAARSDGDMFVPHRDITNE
jgi:hypothetical protein